jgi:predicted dienelactone hydrolase
MTFLFHRWVDGVRAAAMASVFTFLGAGSVSAVERLKFDLPLLDVSVSLNLKGAGTAAELIEANPDLQELDRAGDGSVSRLLAQFLTAPLPQRTSSVLEQSVGHPLLEQALLAASELVKVEGLPPDTSGQMLSDSLQAAYRAGEPHLLGMLRRVPGESLSIDFQALAFYAKRLRANQDDARALVQQGTAMAPAPTSLAESGSEGWSRAEIRFAVAHRSEPLEITMLTPKGTSNGKLVVISHGLWDEPDSFEGWGRLLAANGYTVLLPDHPGSDAKQQKQLLDGASPPPSSEELRFRPLDVSALLDGVQAGNLLSGQSIDIDDVAVVGHSWGATAALQLSGLQTTSRKLKTRCQDPRDPDRNLSWVLQCSWLSGADQGSLADPRVKAAVVVSPPMRLLFDESSGPSLQAKVLLVSGTKDWVVPSDPEAVVPLQGGKPLANGHRLVLASGGSHFNLWAPADQKEAPILGPMILAWINEQLAVPSSHTFSGGGWGNTTVPLVDVTGQL